MCSKLCTDVSGPTLRDLEGQGGDWMSILAPWGGCGRAQRWDLCDQERVLRSSQVPCGRWVKAIVHCPLSALSLRAVKAAAGALVSGPHVFCTCYSVAEPGTPANCVNLGCALRWAEPGEAKASSLRTSVSRKKSQESPLLCVPQGGP